MNERQMVFLLAGTLGFFTGAAIRTKQVPLFSPNPKTKRRTAQRKKSRRKRR